MPVVVCGPSGVGKGTLLTRLTAAHPSRFGFCVSHTTRSPRPGETDGAHMEAAIERGEFLEYARVHSNLYGTSFAAVRTVASRGKTCLLDIDVQEVRLRMSRAKHEISYTERPGFFDDVVVNDDLERAYSAFESIMLSHADQPRP
ncbi:hypothetical protein EMIHUDRAFT_309931 [Emiliania huxleyi CCMP1516]|uniref:Guanylate kinase-like domain-containing protein n=2 Tax=Emiliania huxleyi TaxID=2903 RepID=A0A0D3JW27_EMIH1|nr:hypothetical protein EMIHUDRAFT_309931 [Emiliania huxleyi CCMP1516]EOD27712.1 hypothetical protein EMIHUDRAFT_309931 [Emiliania huxleyi CCMP1516]|eukprot:XP_005780141.1 hypothetical protein EMIHUDRAFT_309931 [Emiliania huxleyi CCMP1516]